MSNQRERAEAFAELHRGPGAFVLANAWDAGTARVLSGLGFRALATTSAGLAFALGRADGAGLVSRAETLTNAQAVIAATDLPVSADLENGFGDRPEDAAETIRLAAEAGLVGGSIEDVSGGEVYDFGLAVERIAAAVEAAKALPFPFTLTARAENFLHGRPDLDDTIRRLQAFADAGADVLYAPGLPDLDSVKAVCAAVDKPVNVLAAGPAARCSVSKLGALGARRISLGSALPRAALTAAVLAAQEIAESGTFTLTTGAMSYAQADALID
ncbi:2-methylisocitrate lyase-like PEP mutase family enzyme [Actinokineospora baliensis]|uniref:isocitrate lyase/PEP mutase family protein n=1 Tax=Actinokineospora baliensis TaxID=547056 RepID=UPI001959566F|nr:isocitrate lyase/phosphoenolpyruvate mutase family protein [Actinokineospora baliensis]MBM7770675.1 2-methylisocitrate lyase-like PEP mutase family enzyme [Actinokineospora baliensis]